MDLGTQLKLTQHGLQRAYSEPQAIGGTGNETTLDHHHLLYLSWFVQNWTTRESWDSGVRLLTLHSMIR